MGIARKVELWRTRGLEEIRDVRRLINSWGFVDLCHDLYNLFAGKILLFDVVLFLWISWVLVQGILAL